MFFEFEKCMRRARALQMKWFGLGVRLAHTLADNYVAEESESTFFQFSFGMFEFIGCVYFRSHVRKKNTHRHRAERDREKEGEKERANKHTFQWKQLIYLPRFICFQIEIHRTRVPDWITKTSTGAKKIITFF